MIEVSDFIFGLGSLGTRLSPSTFKKLYKHAHSLGIQRFDNSHIYGRGLSEYFFERNISNDEKIYSSIKYGRLRVNDLVKFIFFCLRGNFLKLFDSNFLPKNINIINLESLNSFLNFYKKKKSTIIYDTFYFHDISFIEKKIDLRLIKYLKKHFKYLGVTQIRDNDIKFIEKNFDIIQISCEEFIENEKIVGFFKGDIYINKIIKYCRLNNFNWLKLCKEIKSKYKNVKFVIGFNHLSLLQEIENNFNDKK